MSIKNVAFGISINDIVFPEGKTHMGILGGGGPQAAWGMAAALGSGETVGLAAKVRSNLPPDFFAPLKTAGINLDGVQVTDLPTPQAWEVMEFDGARTHLWRVPNDILINQMIRGWEILPIQYQKAKNFHWGLDAESSNKDIINARILKAKDRIVSLEPYRLPNHPLKLNQLRRIVRSCDIFSPNWLEASRITGQVEYSQVIRRFLIAECQILVLRKDIYGADVWNFVEGWGTHVPAVKTKVVDVIGAGNTFCGGFLAQLHNGIEVAACHGSVVASYMIEQVGLPQNLPNLADYNKRLQNVQSDTQRLTL